MEKMKKSILTLTIITVFFATNTYAQNYSKYMQQGKSFYTKGKYLTALERFDLASEFTKTEKEKDGAENWKNKSRKKIRELESKIPPDNPPNNTKILDSLIIEGDKCLKINEFICAAIIYSKILEIDKNNIDILNKLNFCYSRTKQYKKAYHISLNLISLNSLNYKYYYNLSYYALYEGDYFGAIKAAKTSLLLEPEQNMVYSNLAMAYILNNQYGKAEKIYRKYRGRKMKEYYDYYAREKFLKDIKKLEKAGIHHKDFINAKKLLE